MLMTTGAMHMAVRQLFRRCVAHLDDLDVAFHRLAGKRMIQVHIEKLAAYLEHGDGARAGIPDRADVDALLGAASRVAAGSTSATKGAVS